MKVAGYLWLPFFVMVARCSDDVAACWAFFTDADVVARWFGWYPHSVLVSLGFIDELDLSVANAVGPFAVANHKRKTASPDFCSD